MAAEFKDVMDGVVLLKVAESLTNDDRSLALEKIARVVQEYGRISVLVDATELERWEVGLSLDDADFEVQNDAKLTKIAFVGDRKWQDLVFLLINKNSRDVPIEYFETSDLDRARDWLGSQ